MARCKYPSPPSGEDVGPGLRPGPGASCPTGYMTTQPAINKTRSSAGRLKGDECERDWIWEREVETASPAQQLEAASVAWDRQLQHLEEGSPFYVRKFRDAGIDITKKLRLADITNLPFTTKEELKQSIEDKLPFGTNAGVPEDRSIDQPVGLRVAPDHSRREEVWHGASIC